MFGFNDRFSYIEWKISKIESKSKFSFLKNLKPKQNQTEKTTKFSVWSLRFIPFDWVLENYAHPRIEIHKGLKENILKVRGVKM